MRNKVLFALAVIGLLAGLLSAHFYSRKKHPPPPVFNPAPNPYAKGVYSNGIIESYQRSGANTNVFPEVPGVITRILVAEGQRVAKGTPLLTLDDTIQRATATQQQAQAAAALALLEELRAQPRREVLAIAKAQLDSAAASLKTAEDQYKKQNRSYQIEPKSVSKDALDTARNTARTAEANLEVARRQYELTRAGAWSYDIRNQEQQYEALSRASEASAALLAKYTLYAPDESVVLSINASVGSYVSGQGTYDTYTQNYLPVMVLSAPQTYLQVRCFVDEILINKLPPTDRMQAQMFIRGTNISFPMEFVRVQPYVTPKIELSSARTERVDLRVLPVIFRFERPTDVNLFPGQLVDVYIREQ